MQKSKYKIDKIDCPSEEQMIRMKLANISGITKLEFDIPNRLLDVYHNTNEKEITQSISELNLNSNLIKNETIVVLRGSLRILKLAK